ncbi:MAG: DUF3592 domain-containing protein [Clostridia bacterium]|nr:DUF3592 domain-containing protein [Clostridia bacterium]
MISKGQMTKIGLIILVAIILIAIGGGMLIYDKLEYKDYVKTKAIIIGYDEKLDYDTEDGTYNVLYAEIVQYTVEGILYTAKNTIYSTKSTLEKGKQIDIAYDPQYPSQCIFIKSRLVFPIILLSFAGVFILTAILIAILGRRANDLTQRYYSN